MWATARVAGLLATRALPLVRARLRALGEAAQHIPESVLREQAMSSLKRKAFHCVGGSVYSLLASAPLLPTVLDVIVSVQTISDYLDNLSDRAGVQQEAALRGIHQAFLASLGCAPQPSDPREYYGLYPWHNDGGYLHQLVSRARQGLGVLPRYGELLPDIQGLAQLYVELQVLKHLDREFRQPRLERWAEESASQLGWAGKLYWWEFAAACGSTLGVFYLLAMASWQEGKLSPGQVFRSGFFPWVCGIHILLDYFIDIEEDLAQGDLNFVSYYPDTQSAARAMGLIWRNALDCVKPLPGRQVNEAVVRGLPGFYLARSSKQLPELTSGFLEGSLLAGCRLMHQVRLV
ncbi:MAG: DUF2600 family protein [Bacillota bacterium]